MMKYKKKIQKELNKSENIGIHVFVTAVFVLVLSFLSVGYALYTQVVRVAGTLSLNPQGTFRISNVIKTASNNTDNSLPSFTDDTVDFNLTFVKSNEENPVYSATYSITFLNDTFYDRNISDLGLSFSINDTLGNPIGTIDYNVSGVDAGSVVSKLSSSTAVVEIVFTPLVDQDTYNIDGGVDVESNEKPEGNLVAALNNNTGNIKNGAIAQFSVNVISTYDNAVEFNVAAISDKIEICNSSGQALSSFTISAHNEGQNYTFYVKAKDGAIFPDDTLSTSIILRSTGLPNVNAGTITLDVDKEEEFVDDAPPIISDVSAVISDTVGEVNLTWNGEDDSGISSYTILVCNENGTVLNTINTNNDNTSYTVTGLSEGAVASTYLFKVYGTDNADPANTASSAAINSATTDPGACSRTDASSYQWVYKITANVNHGSYSGPTEVNRNQPLQNATLTANWNYNLPNSITVTMGGQTLNSGYSYNSNRGTFSMNNVTGDVVITVACTGGGICLGEGTKVLLANGTYKKIEDINYKDLLAVWSYDTGKIAYEYPIWIEKKHTSRKYQLNTFSDGTTLKTLGFHGIFSVDDNEFISVDNYDKFKIGTTVYKVKDNKLKKVKVKNIEQVNETINYYHVVSSRYYNIIANDFLTTDGTVILSNLYGFDKNITWPKTRLEIISNKDNLYDYADLSDALPKYMFIGMRAEEGKVLAEYGLGLDQFKGYLSENQSAKGKYLEVDKNKNGDKLFMVTTSLDKVNERNKDKYLRAENSYYELPKKKNVKCFQNSIDYKCYKPGDKVLVTAPIYFKAIEKG